MKTTTMRSNYSTTCTKRRLRSNCRYRDGKYISRNSLKCWKSSSIHFPPR
ncbi:uncharacterized protein DS421_4g132220 [Arachis hypogaea]|nr:uncharacterized protein DS421_4g132220 [Arachis hypogaea]